MQTNKQSIAGRILVIAMITCSLPSFANGDHNASFTSAWLTNGVQHEAVFENSVPGESPMDEMDALMTNEVDPDNGSDGPPPPALPLGNGLAIMLYGVAGYVAYKLRRKR